MFNKKILCITLAMCGTSAALGNETTRVSALPAEEDAPRTLGTVTVIERANTVSSNVATRLPAEAMETPFTVLSVSGDIIEETGATRLSDAMRYAATVGGTDNFGNAGEFFSSRGFQLSAGKNYFRDGLRYRKYGQVPLYDIERIEILRGPASVLYGALEPGGVVNIVTKKPEAIASQKLNMRVGEQGYRQIIGDITGPLTERIRYRLQAMHENGTKFRDQTKSTSTGFSGQIDIDLTPKTLLTARASIFRDHRTGDRGTVLARDAQGNINFAEVPRSRFLGEPFAYNDFDDINASVSLRHEVNDNWQVRADLVHSHQDEDRTYIWAMPSDQIVGTNGLLRRQIGDWQARLRGKLGRLETTGKFTLGPTRHRLLIGAEFEDFDNHRENRRYAFPSINIYHPHYLTSRPRNGRQTLNSPYASHFNSRSFYVQDIVNLGEHFTLLAGLRHDHVREKDPRANDKIRQTSDGLTPQIGLVWRPVHWISPYASFTRGFVPQDGVDRSGKAFDPQKSKQYEAGVKLDLSPGRAFFSLAAFRLERFNLKMTDPEDPAFSRLSGLQRSSGVEMTLDAKPMRGLNVILNYAYMNKARIIEDNRYAGRTIANVPKHALGLFADYAFSGTLRGLSANLGVTYVDHRFITPQNNFSLPSYTLVDLGLRYAITPKIDATLNVRNLFDKTYYTGAINSTTIGVGAPRTAYAGLNMHF